MEPLSRIDWKTRALIVGGVVGALAGAGAAYLYIQSAERSGEEFEFKPADGVRIGVMLLGLLKSVAQLGDGK